MGTVLTMPFCIHSMIFLHSGKLPKFYDESGFDDSDF